MSPAQPIPPMNAVPAVPPGHVTPPSKAPLGPPLGQPVQVLLVDDEALARARLRTLLADCCDPPAVVVGEAGDAVGAMHWLSHHHCDVVLLDIHLPGADGMQLAQLLRDLPHPPAVVFVTAHAEHAVQAFELEALDYLTKPVRLARVQAALKKAELRAQSNQAVKPDLSQNFLLIQDRGRTERVALDDIVYLKAELKYVTVRTAAASLIYDGSLNDLEQRHGARWLRIHRNALVARRAVRALAKHHDCAEAGEGAEGWAVRLEGVPEWLPVSRRQLASVREVLGKG